MILIALGSNLGNREENLAAARCALVAYDITESAASSVLETPALMPKNAPEAWNIPYLNQVIAVETHLSPEQLLVCLKHVEQELGRTPRAQWAPREIDLDLLTYNDEIMISEHLILPHEHIDTRRFVLEPLAEIAPKWRHPVLEKTAKELLAELVE